MHTTVCIQDYRVSAIFVYMDIQDEDVKKAFGAVLKRLRTDAQLTQQELGARADIERNYVSTLERANQTPSLTTVLKVAKALNMSVGEVARLVESELGKKV